MKTPTLRPILFASIFACAGLPAVLANDDVESKFKTMDTNGDDKVSRTEHAASAQIMFRNLDANGDGMVTAAEMDAAHALKKDKPDKAAKSASEKIRLIDRDGDGQLSTAEHEAGSSAMFDRMDADHDGFLTEREMKDGHKLLKRDR